MPPLDTTVSDANPRASSPMFDDSALIDCMPVGMYACDANGLIVRYNQAAAQFWGREPRLGEAAERFCGSYRLYGLDGSHIPHAECPMATALATGQDARDQFIQVERPDGVRVTALVNITVLKGPDGTISGAVNVFREGAFPVQTGQPGQPGIPLQSFERVAQALPAAIYTTDAEGRIGFYNEAAAQLWGVRPTLGQTEFSGAWKLYRPDGSALPNRQFATAIALSERRAILGEEATLERPDGRRITFLAYPTPMFDTAGQLLGTINMWVDISGRKSAELASHRLAAIVESSDDAILSKDTNGIINSWNRGAERLFGYAEHEVSGKPVTILIPADRQNEEPEILARVRRGERIEHYETVRQKKNGELVDVSMSVSPIIDAHGQIVGASNVGRDISDRRRADEQKDLLLREMNHRIKNLFALAGGLINLSARDASSVSMLVTDVQSKFLALARAHSLTLSTETDAHQIATLHALIAEVIQPYLGEQPNAHRIGVTGTDVALGRTAVTNVALLLHEFATNALKYGALAHPSGRVEIDCSQAGNNICINWTEIGADTSVEPPTHEGFGSRLARAAIGALGGSFSREFTSQGLEIRLSVPRTKIYD